MFQTFVSPTIPCPVVVTRRYGRRFCSFATKVERYIQPDVLYIERSRNAIFWGNRFPDRTARSVPQREIIICLSAASLRKQFLLAPSKPSVANKTHYRLLPHCHRYNAEVLLFLRELVPECQRLSRNGTPRYRSSIWRNTILVMTVGEQSPHFDYYDRVTTPLYLRLCPLLVTAC